MQIVFGLLHSLKVSFLSCSTLLQYPIYLNLSNNCNILHGSTIYINANPKKVYFTKNGGAGWWREPIDISEIIDPDWCYCYNYTSWASTRELNLVLHSLRDKLKLHSILNKRNHKNMLFLAFSLPKKFLIFFVLVHCIYGWLDEHCYSFVFSY